MSRRHAHRFRPDGPVPLEGRLAPSAGVSHAAASLARPDAPAQTSTAAAHAQAAAKAKAKSSTTTISIDWHKVGNQVTDFLGFTHKSSHPAAHKTAATPAHSLLRR